MIEVLALSSVAKDDIENLLDDAFGTDRRTRTAYLLREDLSAIEHLSFGILEDGTLSGSIQCWPIWVNDAPLTLVGPVAVVSDRQNSGLGRRLMNTMLGAATPQDAPMVMVGDPGYYGRFGFGADGTAGWTLPGPWEPHRLLLRNPLALHLPETGMLRPRL